MMNELMSTRENNSLTVGGDLAAAGAVASHVATGHVFDDYLSRKAGNTLIAQQRDLRVFCEFLGHVGVARDAGNLQTDASGWTGITWGLVESFVKWMLQGGYSVSSVNRGLATIKMYAGLARRAGAVSYDEYLRIKDVSGYGSSEAKRVDAKRPTTRRSNKKVEPVHITEDQAEQLRDKPDTPQGRRDRLLMCLLLDHGLRAGEVSALTVGCMDVASGIMRFNRPKVDKIQNHELSAATLRALRSYIDNGDCPTDSNAPLLRGSRKGGQLDQPGMNEIAVTVRVGVLARQIGIDGMSAHDCRHYWATRWAGRVDVFRLRDAGGWASLAMPNKYVARGEIANRGMV